MKISGNMKNQLLNTAYDKLQNGQNDSGKIIKNTGQWLAGAQSWPVADTYKLPGFCNNLKSFIKKVAFFRSFEP